MAWGRGAPSRAASRRQGARRGVRCRWLAVLAGLSDLFVASLSRRIGAPSSPMLSEDAPDAPAPREFSLLGEGDAARILSAGHLGAKALGGEQRGALTEALRSEVNRAVLKIREAAIVDGRSAEELPVRGEPQNSESVPRQWWADNSEHPHVWRLGVTGGVCAGKTGGMEMLRAELEERSGGRYAAFVVPELATILFNLGVLNHGTFSGTGAAEYRAFGVQMSFLQIAVEEIWALGAEETLRVTPRAQRAVLLIDRDALNFKAFSRPVDAMRPVAWPEVLNSMGELVGRPGLTEDDLVRRYQLGVLVLQTFAVLDGRLNIRGYDAQCVGDHTTNSVRRQTAEEARSDDELVRRAYSDAYPASAVCFITNDVDSMVAKMRAATRCVWQHMAALEGAA